MQNIAQPPTFVLLSSLAPFVYLYPTMPTRGSSRGRGRGQGRRGQGQPASQDDNIQQPPATAKQTPKQTWSTRKRASAAQEDAEAGSSSSLASFYCFFFLFFFTNTYIYRCASSDTSNKACPNSAHPTTIDIRRSRDDAHNPSACPKHG
jgi:hypothetical protein